MSAGSDTAMVKAKSSHHAVPSGHGHSANTPGAAPVPGPGSTHRRASGSGVVRYEPVDDADADELELG